MAQIFISYAREDRSWAEALSYVLERRQWSVWWDADLTYGSSFSEEIERELERAACVIVLWSKHSVASAWVKTEAAEGANRNVLVPVFIEPVRLPLEFRRLHTGDLSAWDRETETPEILALIRAVEALIARREAEPALVADAVAPTLPSPPAPRRPAWSPKLVLIVLAMIVGAGVVVPWLWFRNTDSNVAPAPKTESAEAPPTNTAPIVASAVPGMLGAGFSPRGFVEYVKYQKFDWRPQFIVVHHTSAPTLAQWKRMSGEQRMDQMAKLFKDRGWSGGPHLFVDDNQIWVLNPLTKPGIHASSWNKISLGVEIVGDYTKEPFDGRVRDNTVSAITTLSAALGLDPRSLRFHSEVPMVNKPACPGANVKKDDLIQRVEQELARRRAAA